MCFGGIGDRILISYWKVKCSAKSKDFLNNGRFGEKVEVILWEVWKHFEHIIYLLVTTVSKHKGNLVNVSYGKTLYLLSSIKLSGKFVFIIIYNQFLSWYPSDNSISETCETVVLCCGSVRYTHKKKIDHTKNITQKNS